MQNQWEEILCAAGAHILGRLSLTSGGGWSGRGWMTQLIADKALCLCCHCVHSFGHGIKMSCTGTWVRAVVWSALWCRVTQPVTTLTYEGHKYTHNVIEHYYNSVVSNLWCGKTQLGSCACPVCPTLCVVTKLFMSSSPYLCSYHGPLSDVHDLIAVCKP